MRGMWFPRPLKAGPLAGQWLAVVLTPSVMNLMPLKEMFALRRPSARLSCSLRRSHCWALVFWAKMNLAMPMLICFVHITIAMFDCQAALASRGVAHELADDDEH